jgi:ADP-heptose:LPS heptosyltransferase
LWAVGGRLSGSFDRELDPAQLSRILVFQGGGIGDVLRIVPAVLALRRALPGVHVTVLSQHGEAVLGWLGHHEEAPLFEHRLYDLERRHRSLTGKIGLMRELRQERFDAVISFNYGLGMLEAMLMARGFGAPHTLGFDRRGAGFLYTMRRELVLERPIAQQELDLLAPLGVATEPLARPLRVPDEDLANAQAALERTGAAGEALVALAPEISSGTRYDSFPTYRAWPAERFGALAEALMADPGVRVVFVGQSPPRQDHTAASGSGGRILDLRGSTSLRELAAILAAVDVFVGNDSGPLHLASGLGTRSVGIFGATCPSQVIQSGDDCLPIWKGLACSPCFVHDPLFGLECSYDVACLRSIEVGEVLLAVRRLLARC